jgi:hypothetical protein
MSHVLDFAVCIALIIVGTTHFYFEFDWLVSILLGPFAFVLIRLLVVCWYGVIAFLNLRSSD